MSILILLARRALAGAARTPCVAIKQSDLELKSLGFPSASLSFSICVFSVPFAQSGPPEKRMPVQQQGEIKFLVSVVCQANILAHPLLPPITPENPQKSCHTLSPAQFQLDLCVFCSIREIPENNPPRPLRRLQLSTSVVLYKGRMVTF